MQADADQHEQGVGAADGGVDDALRHAAGGQQVVAADDHDPDHQGDAPQAVRTLMVAASNVHPGDFGGDGPRLSLTVRRRL
ncbi:hypothetical protein GCM10010168_20010 [Actinoplanes ianthinogenes]|uniref:Uncharacterized protein n=1 Tax=Actinoplanes ianthinogenes TaxID=122358 RepID=A0ABM7M7Q0_9ACTN|nr:hypothetical protein Aiant_83000 [Actinoplanes ianthinogenes]GGR03136.1 hypothetical protein GCM10010168_20010 [Actinoplanes ianthinogenes]